MACACMTERFSQVQIDLGVSLEGAVWPTACLHANRCRTLSATVRRAGAEAEAGVRRGWQAAQLSRGKVCCLSIFCLASNDAVVHENDLPSACARAQGSACARVHMAVAHVYHAGVIIHVNGDVHAA